MNEKRKRNIIIFTLCGVLLFMTIGYAAFNTLLTINGTTSISSNWDIKIIGITSKDVVGDASDGESAYEDLTATFNANLVSPGDSITYDITVENKGNINAELDSIDVSENTNENIKIATSGIAEGDKLNPSSTATLSVKITYSDEVTSQPDNLTANLTVTLNYVQEGTGMPATIDFETESTTRAITVTVPEIKDATKYEFRKDTEGWVSNDDPTNNVYTFDQITHNTEHNIQVKVTKGDKVIESEIKPVMTEELPTPSVNLVCASDGEITFGPGCGSLYTCSYSSNREEVGSGTVEEEHWSDHDIYAAWGLTDCLNATISDGFNETTDNECMTGGCGPNPRPPAGPE